MTTYNFKDKTLGDIVETFASIINSGSSSAEEDIAAAFDALACERAPFKRRIVDEVEKMLIEQASLDGRKWERHLWEGADLPSRSDWTEEYEMEKQALLNDLERLRPMSKAFLRICVLKSGDAQPWTKAFQKEFLKIAGQNMNTVEKLADCFAAVYAQVGEAPLSEPKPAKLSLAAAARLTAAAQQQKLNKFAAQRQFKISINQKEPGL